MSDQAKNWWRNAVFYQVYPRSFADANGDGVGDLEGLRSRLGYLHALGVDAVWLSPVMRSPMADHGYDVSDPRDIDPLFGDLREMKNVIDGVHEHGMRIIMDLVPNHTSSEHEWFRAAVHATPGSAERARYIFRPGLGIDGDQPPNNWLSVFGGPAWTRITEPDGSPGEWYLHLFAPEQPDLNWENPEVMDDLATTMRFWLDLGVDGFRIDVAHGMAKPPELPDLDLTRVRTLFNGDDDIRFNNDGVHDIHRKIRAVVDEYDDRVLVGEIWVRDSARFSRYVQPDQLHLGFNFRLVEATYGAESFREAISSSLEAIRDSGAPPTWTLSNHDVVREVTRYGGGAQGSARAAAAALMELALPGVVFIYNGAELGLPNIDDLPEDRLQDPVWERSGHVDRGRDGCRVPLPWWGDEPPFGFGTNPDTWLPMPALWGQYTVESMSADHDSFLTVYRHTIRLRKELLAGVDDSLSWVDAPQGVLAFRRGPVLCILNTTNEAVELPPGKVVAASQRVSPGVLPTDTAVWISS
ncbi:glycoside hydrolase family 13 protein [Hoyosella rhizosphaerae]|uniref:Alpha-amylase family protein n=1 Tax=Hoyosella rhizosphaerae TaxID=1755582 RepID=A0A916UGW5_9ACTN|nr:glycoside hydrolase family 13 protein [Hoyosella rhizosphaerae]MBN4928120.1 glycoside hydrolase family 13 protein [Hoyosella rhizosphaerae]GGC72524.1 alpha-amylase family protein [Hoyosella rhizosphaerae]